MGLFDTHLLSLIVLLPLLGAAACLAFPKNDDAGVRGLAMIVAFVDLVLSIVAWVRFDLANTGMQLVEKVDWVPSLGISYSVGVDGIALVLVLLTTFLAPIVILSTYSSVTEHVREYMFCLLLLQTGMLGAFVATDLFLFYVFWEVMLVPMYFLIGIWGGRRRIYAAIKFFLYTMAGSLLMLVAILYTVWAVKGQGGVTFSWAEVAQRLQTTDLGGAEVWLFLAFAVAFAIKVPMFPFHTWLPDAHVEAPTGGSVILAGVLLKLGTFGFLRYAMWLYPKAAVLFLPALGVLAVIGIIYGALVAMVQTDLKRLVAYSSVSHLGFVMLGLAAMTVTGVSGGVLQMLNHGISTGGLFLLVGVIYERRHTRQLEDFGGLAKVMPRYALAFVFIMLSSVGLPGLNGFVGEFMILMGSFQSEGLEVGLTNGGVARVGVLVAALMGMAAVALIAVTVLRRRNRENLDLPAQLGAVAAVAIIGALLFSPPMGGFAGGLLVRPLSGLLGTTAAFRELFALLTVCAATGVIFAAVYLLIATQKVFFGPIRHHENEGLADLSVRESAVLLPIALAALVMGLYPKPLLDTINPTVEAYAREFRARAQLAPLAQAAPALAPGVREPRIPGERAPMVVPPSLGPDRRDPPWRRMLRPEGRLIEAKPSAAPQETP